MKVVYGRSRATVAIAAFERTRGTPVEVGSKYGCLGVAVGLMRWSQARMGDDILNYRPTGDEERIWEAGTQLPFDPFVSSVILIDLDVECPKCEQQISTRKTLLLFRNKGGLC